MVINEKVHPNRVTRRTIRAIFHLASTSPERSSETRNILLGYAGFVKTYNPQLAQKYLAIARSFKS
jgi:hypothetical protein